MFFLIFHQDSRKIFTGTRGRKSRYDHFFGGSADYHGLRRSKEQPSAHLLFRLNMADPAVGIDLPGVQWLPLLCAIRYGACALGYRVLADEAVEILHQKETKAWDGFPYDGYPEKLPEQPLALKATEYDPDKPKDAYVLAGAFGCETLTPRQFNKLVHFLVDQGLYPDPDLLGGDWDSPDEYLREAHAWPFVQGRPDEDCPDQACPNHGRTGSMRVFAVFQEEQKNVRRLWGPNCGSLQIIYQTCPQCNAIRVSNQCT